MSNLLHLETFQQIIWTPALPHLKRDNSTKKWLCLRSPQASIQWRAVVIGRWQESWLLFWPGEVSSALSNWRQAAHQGLRPKNHSLAGFHNSEQRRHPKWHEIAVIIISYFLLSSNNYLWPEFSNSVDVAYSKDQSPLTQEPLCCKFTDKNLPSWAVSSARYS